MEPSSVSFSDMSLPELRRYAASIGIDTRQALTRNQLLGLLPSSTSRRTTGSLGGPSMGPAPVSRYYPPPIAKLYNRGLLPILSELSTEDIIQNFFLGGTLIRTPGKDTSLSQIFWDREVLQRLYTHFWLNSPNVKLGEMDKLELLYSLISTQYSLDAKALQFRTRQTVISEKNSLLSALPGYSGPLDNIAICYAYITGISFQSEVKFLPIDPMVSILGYTEYVIRNFSISPPAEGPARYISNNQLSPFESIFFGNTAEAIDTKYQMMYKELTGAVDPQLIVETLIEYKVGGVFDRPVGFSKIFFDSRERNFERLERNLRAHTNKELIERYAILSDVPGRENLLETIVEYLEDEQIFEGEESGLSWSLNLSSCSRPVNGSYLSYGTVGKFDCFSVESIMQSFSGFEPSQVGTWAHAARYLRVPNYNPSELLIVNKPIFSIELEGELRRASDAYLPKFRELPMQLRERFQNLDEKYEQVHNKFRTITGSTTGSLSHKVLLVNYFIFLIYLGLVFSGLYPSLGQGIVPAELLNKYQYVSSRIDPILKRELSLMIGISGLPIQHLQERENMDALNYQYNFLELSAFSVVEPTYQVNNLSPQDKSDLAYAALYTGYVYLSLLTEDFDADQYLRGWLTVEGIPVLNEAFVMSAVQLRLRYNPNSRFGMIPHSS